jgi:beta-lactamase class A
LRVVAASVALFFLVGVASADVGGGGALERAIRTYLAPLRAAAQQADAGRGGPDAVQAQYDAARDLAEALRSVSPVPMACTRRYAAASAYASAETLEAEGYDRLSPGIIALGARRARYASLRLSRTSEPCRQGGGSSKPWPVAPASYSISIGRLRVSGRVPSGVDRMTVKVNGGATQKFPARGPTFSLTVARSPGRYTVDIRFFSPSGIVATSRLTRVWLLPASASAVLPATKNNRQWSQRLRLSGEAFTGYVAFWVQDLTTGMSAGWNADALFPAASTVKLGVLVAALKQFGPRAENSRYGYDIGALAGWSSNLAANRLVSAMGGDLTGSSMAEATLHRLGATSSTYTGYYRVGTSALPAGDAPRQPPFVSRRLTTARDLGRVLYVLHAGAMGDPSALRLLELSRHEAQAGLNVLLSSEPTGDNLGLVRPAVARSYPIAQKNGWLSDARHTAAILYTPHGPVIVVILTFRPEGISRSDAAKTALAAIRLARP